MLSETGTVILSDTLDARGRYLVSNDALRGYRAIVADLEYTAGRPVPLSTEMCTALNVSEGSPIRMIAL